VPPVPSAPPAPPGPQLGYEPGYQPGYQPGQPPGYAQGYQPGYAPGYSTPEAPPPFHPAYGYAAPVAPTNVSAIVLTVIAGLLTISCYFSLAGIPGLVLGIIALTQNNSDPAGSRRMSKIGWIVLGVVAVLHVIVYVVLIAMAVKLGSSLPSSTSSYSA
jgi:hypothetical protein